MMRKLLSLSIILMLIFQSWWSFALEWGLLELDSSWIAENSPPSEQSESALEEQLPWESLLENENWPEEWWSEFFSWKNSVGNTIESMESLAWEALSWQASLRGGNNENSSFEQETTPKLLITEVYFDGNNERIEIFNSGSEDFSWWLRIQSPEKNRDFSAHISAGQLMIFAKNNTTLSGIGSQALNISLTDTKAIALKLIFNGEEVDTFSVPENEVKKLNDKQTSFEKIEENWSFTIVPTTQARTRNMQAGYFWNPWRAFDFAAWEVGNQEPEATLPSSWTEAKLIITEAFFSSNK